MPGSRNAQAHKPPTKALALGHSSETIGWEARQAEAGVGAQTNSERREEADPRHMQSFGASRAAAGRPGEDRGNGSERGKRARRSGPGRPEGYPGRAAGAAGGGKGNSGEQRPGFSVRAENPPTTLEFLHLLQFPPFLCRAYFERHRRSSAGPLSPEHSMSAAEA